ncbi:hypothetical protein GCM10007928_36030 [Sulfitobacter porphyrae]|nr:hypothetical protein GCM10007928_36030 [Sulfitobacter porphyrae]
MLVSPGLKDFLKNDAVLIDLAQAQVEPDKEPDNMSDDPRWKPVALVADLLCLHRHPLGPDQCPSNLTPVTVTISVSGIYAFHALCGVSVSKGLVRL